ncbi:MAG: DUF5667 domain-containing protein [Candidatus Paceibacterota bacterium]
MVKTSEKELISKLQELRQIKPEKDWVSLTKTRILGEDPGFYFLPFFKPALVGATFAFVLFVFGFVQNSVPGDFLYSVKKIAEKGQAIFVSDQERPQANLELAGKRLEELAKIAETNQTRKLPQAINEFQTSVSEANKSLERNADPVAVKRIVDQIEKKMQAISSLGVVVDGEELGELIQNTDRRYAEYLISELEKNALTEEQEEILNQMKELAEEGNYSAALELYLTSQ